MYILIHMKLYEHNTQIKLLYIRIGNWSILSILEIRGHAEEKYRINCFSFLVALTRSQPVFALHSPLPKSTVP